jgi:hypothetical protein
MNTLVKTSILAAALFAAGAAVAQSPQNPPQAPQAAPPQQMQKGFTGEHRSGPWSGESFSRLDTNRDGMISREEAQADPMVRDAWGKLDARNAGRVSRADFDKYGASQPQSNQFNSGGSAPTTTTK